MMELPFSSQAVDNLIRDVAAIEILPYFKRLTPADIAAKGDPRDMVTVVDVRSEKALTKGLQKLAVNSVVLGEEAVHSDPSMLNLLKSGESIWLIDPLDGTGNYIAGDVRFGVIVAYLRDSKVQAGWIYDPLTDTMVWGLRGRGVWREKERLRVPDMPPVSLAKGRLTPRFYRRDLREHLEKAVTEFADVDTSLCCAHDFMMALDGRASFAAFRGNRPWDVAAGQFLYQEAGGFAQHVDGSAYRPGQGEGLPLLLAPDRENWFMLRDRLFPLSLAA